MYDSGKIITGLVIFVILCTFPFWFNLGKVAYEAPDLELPEEEKKCVEPTSWMRAHHMQLLNNWRDEVVRENQAKYLSSFKDKEIEIGLQNTCMDCHDNKEKFCDRCHNRVSVTPYCWDCHIAPEEIRDGQ